MDNSEGSKRGLWREHPVFFWGAVLLLVGLVAASAVVYQRVPTYRAEAALFDRRMTEAERATRDRLLQSQAKRSEMALALLSREIRVKAADEKGLHLAISVDDSAMYLRHGPATLRQIPIRVGADSVVRAPDGRSWRFVRGLGERHIQDKQVSPTYTVPEWVYISRGEPVPPEAERQVKGALGRYVLLLDDGVEVYSTPEAGPFQEGVKPAAFVASERDLRTMFDAVKEDMPVFIY